MVDIGAYIRSYFYNYTFFILQRSTDNGLNWTDAGSIGTGVPVWNASAYEYYTAYPTFVANMADSGLKFRVVVASTISNISDVNCSFADASSILTLNVIDCGYALKTDIISFSGKNEEGTVKLNWVSGQENNPVRYEVERSLDGVQFSRIAEVNGLNGSEVNYYKWSGPFPQTNTAFYRIRLIDGSQQRISRVVRLSSYREVLSLASVINPFNDKLQAEVNAASAQVAQLQLIDNSGRVVKMQQVNIAEGYNNIQIETAKLPKGLYTLQLRTNALVINKRVLKQ